MIKKICKIRRYVEAVFKNKTLSVAMLLTLVIIAGIPESFATAQYAKNLTAVYGDGSCGICHVKPTGGGVRNQYGMLFENQSNHATDPSAALMVIGKPPMTTATSQETPISYVTPGTTATAAKEATGFEVVLSLVGLFAIILLTKMRRQL